MYNYNKSEVLSQTQVGGLDPVPASTIFNIENNLPKHRANVGLTHSMNRFSATIRGNYYGSTIDERGGQEEVGSEILLDLELTYEMSGNLTFIAGANNILNNYPDEIATRLSQGMPFPRRTPIGYHGGMGYARIVYAF